MKSYSEHSEDRWIMKNIKLPKWGFYVDIGAAHPTHMSNTAFLRDLGWLGIQIDADPYWIPYWKKEGLELINRTVYFSNKVVPFTINKTAHRLSKVEMFAKPPSNDPITGFYSTPLVLNYLFDKMKITHIDLMSLDVEGLEYEIFYSLEKKYWPDILIFEYDTLGKKDYRLQKALNDFKSFKELHKTANNFIFSHEDIK